MKKLKTTTTTQISTTTTQISTTTTAPFYAGGSLNYNADICFGDYKYTASTGATGSGWLE